MTKAIEIRPDDGFAHWGRVTVKKLLKGDRGGAYFD